MSAGQIAAAAVAVLLAAGAFWRRRSLSGERKLLAGAAVLVLAIYASGVLSALPDPKKLIGDIAETLGAWTYALVGVMAFLETGAFVGLVAPGETVVIAGGVIAGQGEIELIPLIGLVWVCAVLGDTTSFYIGRRLGRSFLERHGPRVKITHERLEQVEGYFDRHGGKTILIGRFIGLVRALAPFIAGASGLAYRRFLPYSVVGTGSVVDRLLRARLHLLALLRSGRARRRPGDLRVRADRRRDRRDRGRLPAPPRHPRLAARARAAPADPAAVRGRPAGLPAPGAAARARRGARGSLHLGPDHAGRARPGADDARSRSPGSACTCSRSTWSSCRATRADAARPGAARPQRRHAARALLTDIAKAVTDLGALPTCATVVVLTSIVLGGARAGGRGVRARGRLRPDLRDRAGRRRPASTALAPTPPRSRRADPRSRAGTPPTRSPGWPRR